MPDILNTCVDLWRKTTGGEGKFYYSIIANEDEHRRMRKLPSYGFSEKGLATQEPILQA